MEPNPQVKKILNEINYDFRAFTIDHFIGWIEAFKGRKIITIPWTMPSGMFGAWMSDGDEPREYIFYRDNVALLHKIHIQQAEPALCGNGRLCHRPGRDCTGHWDCDGSVRSPGWLGEDQAQAPHAAANLDWMGNSCGMCLDCILVAEYLTTA